MRYIILIAFLLTGSQSLVYSQSSLKGKITDEKNQPLAGSHVHASSFSVTTNEVGNYLITGISKEHVHVFVEHLGYKTLDTLIDLSVHTTLNISLQQETALLSEVIVQSDSYTKRVKKNSSENIEIIDKNFLRKNLGGSLMQSLERVGGISTISIGSGQSKPVIRGLSFNRVVVTENGVKHEGQQWGADHGLEIDQYAVDNIKIIKGPFSLTYGSDAIGGVIEIEKAKAPLENTFGGFIDSTGKTNNDLYGTSINLFGRKKSLFFDARITSLDYADYKVPVDFINIYSYKAPLHKNRLRNTAGKELNLHFTAGIIKDHFSSTFYVSNLRTKSGLFANAHGLEPRNVDTDLHDFSNRDIQNPSQEVNHFKVINRTKIDFETHKLAFELGYQNNLRQEFGDYISHGFMPPNYPEDLPIQENLERGFSKNVYSFNVKDHFSVGNHNLTLGINTEHQNNNIAGWGFIIPEYKQAVMGVFAYDKWEINPKLLVHLGLRYDYGSIETGNYFDWFTSPIGNSEENLQRATAITRNFNSASWGIGINYNREHFFWRANLGKSFRMPIAKELTSNGVNYHQFSYELGDANLDAEQSYQLDLGLTYERNNFSADVSPFFNYFTNYIYLNPTSNYDYSYGAGNQIYNYTQSEVLRYGGEIKLHYAFTPHYSSEIIGEYVYSEQMSGPKKGYTLPFSPPPSVLFNFTYTGTIARNIQNSFAGIDFKMVASQTNIVPPEETTAAYNVINLSLGTDLLFDKQRVSINFQVQNLLDSKNFNHTSFYRLIGVPEPGRNFVLSLKIPFLFNKGV